MLVLGLDISSNSTGWGLIEDDKLLEYGLIKPEGSMETIQRLYFFGNEIKKVIEKYNPDEIAIEEIVFVHGPRTMKILARFSGVALFQAYSYQKRDIKLYEPQVWKKKLDLKGLATKPEVQLGICKKFDLLDSDKIKKYEEKLILSETGKKQFKGETRKKLGGLNKEILDLEKIIKENKRNIKKKKKREITQEELDNLKKDEMIFNDKKEELKLMKKENNKKIKEFDMKINQISLDIYSDTGVNSDVADSIGVALACIDETQ